MEEKLNNLKNELMDIISSDPLTMNMERIDEILEEIEQIRPIKINFHTERDLKYLRNLMEKL